MNYLGNSVLKINDVMDTLNSDIFITAILLSVGWTYEINHLDNDLTDNHHVIFYIKITEKGILLCGLKSHFAESIQTSDIYSITIHWVSEVDFRKKNTEPTFFWKYE